MSLISYINSIRDFCSKVPLKIGGKTGLTQILTSLIYFDLIDLNNQKEIYENYYSVW